MLATVRFQLSPLVATPPAAAASIASSSAASCWPSLIEPYAAAPASMMFQKQPTPHVIAHAVRAACSAALSASAVASDTVEPP